MEQNQQSKPRILFSTSISGLGGGETSLLNFLTILKKNDFQPILLCPAGQLQQKAAHFGIDTINLDFPPVRMFLGIIPNFSLMTIFKLYRLIKDFKVDIVHIESLLAFYYLGPAAFLANRPCVATYHGYWHLDSKISRIMLKLLCKKIFPVSETTAIEINSILKLTEGKIKKIPLGVNEQFSQELPPKQEVRKILNLPLDRSIVIQIARFQPIKGQIYLLEALALLHKEINILPPIVIFIGDILDKTTGEAIMYKEKVLSRAQLPDVRDHVLFLGWQDNIPSWIKAADIVVIPSEFETFSMATIEAMSVGTPVIATSSGGPAEIISDQITGFLVPPRNPQALSNAINNVLTNPAQSDVIASSAKEYASANYSQANRYNLMVKEYLQLWYPKKKVVN